MTKHLVIIPIFNDLVILKKTLKSYIVATDLRACETALIDDGSGKSTKKYLENFIKQNSSIGLYRNRKNLGKPKSVNKIIHAHPGMDYYTIIDSDVKIFTRNWHEILLRAHKIWRSQAILGAELHLRGFLFKKGGMEFGDLFPFWTLPGGFFSIPGPVFKKLGYFYDKIRRHEDADYCRRAATQNIRWYYTTDIKARGLPHVSVSRSRGYAKHKKREEKIYKKRAEYIMRTHRAYYNPFQKGI